MQWFALLAAIIVDVILGALVALSLGPVWAEPDATLTVPNLSLYLAPLAALAMILVPTVFFLRLGWKEKFGIRTFLLPLRLALAYEFVSGGLEKLLSTTYLSGPGLIGLGAASAPSPWTRAVMSAMLPNYVFFLLLIATGELLVGLSMLLGGFTRLGAIGGVLLMWTFLFLLGWLSVSTFGINFVGGIAFLALGMLQAGRYVGVDQFVGPRLEKSGNRILHLLGLFT
jgi:uncharacterized membrane protein YphA (DoxX/SURF4 family)